MDIQAAVKVAGEFSYLYTRRQELLAEVAEAQARLDAIYKQLDEARECLEAALGHKGTFWGIEVLHDQAYALLAAYHAGIADATLPATAGLDR